MSLTGTVLTVRLLKIAGLGGLGFAIAGVIIAQLFQVAQVTVLVDRSACGERGWQQVSDRYTKLYQSHERRQIQLTQIVLISEVGEEVRESLPTPDAFQRLETYGDASPERVAQLTEGFAEVVVLTC